MVIVGLFVAGYSPPIQRSRSNAGVGKLLDKLVVELFGVSPFLVHEGYPGIAHDQVGGKFVFGEIALDAKTLFAVFAEYEDCRRP